MANKVIPNYDNTLVGEYIRQIENPDSIGWNSIRKIWEAPALSGYDKRNRGMGIDILNNEDAKTLTENRPGRYLTESEERQLRNKHIDYLYGAIDRHKDTIPGLIDMSPRKEAEVMGALYRGDAKKLWSSETPIGKALRSDNEEDFHKAISDYYNSEGLKERAKNNDAFWMNHAQPATEPVQSSIKSIFDQTTNTVKDAIHQIVPHGASGRWSEGGSLGNPWDGLSLQEKAEMMKVAVRNGITDLKTIKEKYNEFAEGGNILDGGGGLTPSQEAMRYFMNKGLTDYQAAGLVGNLIRESQLIPTATNAGSGAYGIAQWLGPRKKALVSRYGKSPSLQQQLDFVWDELNSTHKTGLSKLKSSRDVAEAARNAMGYYEFSAGPEAAVREMKKWGQDGEGSIRKGIKLASALFGQPVPEYTIVQEVPVVQEAPAFVPVHPEVFGLPVTRREEPIVFGLPEPTVEAVKMPTEAELKRQERHEGMRRLNMLLGMLNSTDASSPYDGVVSMLTGSRVQPFSIFGEGGGIYIKPENRGKFTRLKERTGHSATWFKEHGTPAQRKMATFALNARHWKHGLGGPLVEAANIYDGTTEPTQQMNTGNVLAYYPDKDYYTGPQTRLPEVTVTGEAPSWLGKKGLYPTRYRYNPSRHVSARTKQLTASDAMKGIDAATGPLLHWTQPSQYVGAVRDAINGKNPLTSILRGNSGVVSEEYAQEHPWLSTAFNLGTDAAIYRAGAGIFNTFDKLSRYKRLEKNYTGVPHKQTKGTSVYMDESFPTVHHEHTVWTSDDPDYAGMFTLAEDGGKKTYGTVFDVYTDPKELSVLETPSVPEGQMVYWQGLPYKLKDGKVSYADNIDVREAIIPKTKEIAVKNRDKYGRYDFDDTGSYIWKDGEGSMPIADWNAVPGAIKTDHVVNYSRNNGFQATRFNRVYDGGVTLNDAGVFDYQLGNYYDYPINELVLNPGAPKYVLPHGTPRYKVFNQLPSKYSSNLLYNLLPLTIPTKLNHE